MKNKGFTLIELLAVIVILAIIAVIAVPIVLNVIEKARQGAAESSSLGYIDAVEKQVMINKVKDEESLLINEGEYTKEELTAKNLNIKGDVTDALVLINNKGKVTQGKFCIDGYSIDYDGKEAKINKEEKYCEEIESILNALPKGTEYVFDYTGEEQEFTAPKSGQYKVELWGAGKPWGSLAAGGAYVSGNISLKKNETLYVYVGGQPKDCSVQFNIGYQSYSCHSSGATDIRLVNGEWNNTVSLRSRIIVAGGAGGVGGCNDWSVEGSPAGGSAGGLAGYSGGACYQHGKNYRAPSIGGNQTAGGAFGYSPASTTGGPTGGNGYYSGYSNAGVGGCVAGAGGGSSYISGHTGCVAITSSENQTPRKGTDNANCTTGTTDNLCSIHYSEKAFTDTKMVDGLGYEWTNSKASTITGMPTLDGTSTMNGNNGNGYAKITYLGE